LVEQGTQERLAGLDWLRSGSLLAVVFIHAGGWLVDVSTPADRGLLAAAVTAARFSVPALVLASGFALYLRYGGRPPGLGFVRRRYVRVLVPFAAWLPVFALVSLWNGDYEPGLRGLGVWVLFGAGHLYFLLLIAQLYLLLLVLPSRARTLALVTAVAVAVQLALAAWHTYAAPLEGALSWPLTRLPVEEGPYWAGYFTLGCLAAAYAGRLRELRAWLPAGLLALALVTAALTWLTWPRIPHDYWREGSYVYLWPLMLPYTLFTAAMLAGGGPALGRLSPALAAGVGSLSRHSLGVYVLHVLALAFIGRWVASWPDALRLPVMIVGALAAGYALTLVLSRSRVGALALGEPPPLRRGRLELAT
jgi:surface polysaccharide O-acyltransferase-like enzyme